MKEALKYFCGGLLTVTVILVVFVIISELLAGEI